MNKKQIDQVKMIKLNHEILLQISRVPGYSDIILTVLALSLKERIAFFKVILSWLKRYSEMQIKNLELKNEKKFCIAVNGKEVPFKQDFTIKVKYQCVDCKKWTEEKGSPLFPGKPFCLDMAGQMAHSEEEPEKSWQIKKSIPHLVCDSCYMKYYYEPNYEPNEEDV